MAHTALNPSPFGCRFIERGSEIRISNWSYALCRRLGVPRLVSEEECARGARGEAPQDHSPVREARRG